MNLRSIPLRLSIMFGLAQMSEGAVLVLLSGHMGALGFTGQQISYVFASTALAALISPIIAGWLADRYWAPQQFLAGCQLISAPIVFAAWLQTEFVGFWITMLLFALIRLPSMTLTNVIAFYHLGKSEGYGFVRVWGTIGWIAIAWALSLHLRLWESWDPVNSHLGDGLLFAAVLFAIAGLYSFTLPHTPPGGGNASKKPYAFLSAFRLLRQRNFAVIVAISFVSAVVSPFFNNFSFLFLIDPREIALAPSTANWVQSLGQVVEIVVLLALASSLRRLGLKRILLMGIGAQTLRMTAFAIGGPTWLVAGSMAMHGFIFTFFFIGLVIAVEELSEPEYRASAQGLLTFARGGIGALCGNFMAGRVYDSCALPDGGRDWTPIFAIPAAVTFLSLLFFALFFCDRQSQATDSSDRSATAG